MKIKIDDTLASCEIHPHRGNVVVSVTRLPDGPTLPVMFSPDCAAQLANAIMSLARFASEYQPEKAKPKPKAKPRVRPSRAKAKAA